MGNRPRLSGAEQIANAEALFEETRDFRYVSLAIGAAPIKPPFWAMWECVAEHHRTERRARANLTEIDVILDEMAREIAREHFLRFDGLKSDDLPFPSLAQFIRRACRATGLRADKMEHKADANWSRDIRREWNHEQEHPSVYDAWQLPTVKMTPRIERIVTEMVGNELGLPADPIRDIWLSSLASDRA